MRLFCLLSAVLLIGFLVQSDSDAGIFRNRGGCGNGGVVGRGRFVHRERHTIIQRGTVPQSLKGCANGQCTVQDGDVLPVAPAIALIAEGQASPGAVDALDEVNATRAARGLRPFTKCQHLTSAALGAAKFRADRMIQGHTSNDFAFGGDARAAGCAAWPQGMGWGSCCTYENHTFAGAAYAIGLDGRRYMHLFVR